jgi:serine phosphatase RsbU (regulator of sigma subunit)
MNTQMTRVIKALLHTVLFLFSASSFSQAIDQEIVKAESAPNDSLKVTTLCMIAIKHYSVNATEAMAIVKKAFSHTGNNPNLSASCHMAEAYIYNELYQNDKAAVSLRNALKLFAKARNYKRVVFAYDRIIAMNKRLNDREQVLQTYPLYVDAAKKVAGWETIRKAYREYAGYYSAIGQRPKAVMVLQEQLNYANTLQPSSAPFLVSANMDIAYNYFNAENFGDALNYAKASYENAKITKDNFQLLDAYNTIGACYKGLRKERESIVWFEKAVELLEKQEKGKIMLSSVLMNLSGSYYELNEFEKGREYKQRALKLCQEAADVPCLLNLYISLGLDLIDKEKDYVKGIGYLNEAEQILAIDGDLYKSRYVYEGLYKGYSAKGDYENAFKSLSKFVKYRDSIMTSEKQKQMNELETKYESAKKQQQIELLGRNRRIQELQLLQNRADLDREKAENEAKKNSILVLEKDNALNEANLKEKQAETEIQKTQLILMDEQKKMSESENRNQRIIIYSFFGGVCLLVVLLFNIYRGYQQKKRSNVEITRQKQELQVQKHFVDEKNKEILDSITYAKRLQDAILPPLRTIADHLSESFILYMPKDIVAGDFYWMERVKEGQQDVVLIAAADCTGHGVPGAMVSVVCSNALNRSVKEFGLREPGKILDKVRELVIETFDKSESEVKDGMDISLISLNVATRELKWAGANNPLWVLKHDSKEMMEVKADKQPVGRHVDPKPFTTQASQLQASDIVYLFTDGYPDQFGGPKGKKFKYSALGTLLKTISGEKMNVQNEKLRTVFLDWKGELEQVDDVCVIGIRV